MDPIGGAESGVLVSFDDEDVELACAQGRHAGRLLRLLDAQVDAGQGVREVGQRWDEGGATDGEEGSERHRSRHLAGQWAQGLEGLGDVCVDALPGLGHDAAGGGEDRAGGRALDELEPDLLLQFLDLLGDSRWGHHEDVCGGDDAAFTCNREQEG